MPGNELDRISDLEERLAVPRAAQGSSAIAELEALADLYLHADHYVPALETIDRLLELAREEGLEPSRRVAFESKAIVCRIAQGDCRGALAHARDVLVGEGEIDSPAARGRLHLLCAEALYRLGRNAEARESSTRGLAIADAAGELALSAQALNLLGRAAYRDGDMSEARDLYEQALALYRRLGADSDVAHVRNNLGLVHKHLCDWEAAIAHLESALAGHRRSGRLSETANPLMNLGVVHQKRGDWTRASECYAQARQVYLRVGDRLRPALAEIGLGNIARLERRFDEAARSLNVALARAREQGALREEALALEFIGELQADRGRDEEAMARYREALAIADRIAPGGDLTVEIERRRAEALCRLGRVDEAEAACTRARRHAEETHDRLEHAICHRVAAEIAARRGSRAEAAALAARAATLLGACHERYELGRTLLELAGLHEDVSEARRCLYRAGALFADLPIRYWLERTETQLSALVNGMASHTAPAASTIGRRHRAPGLVACSTAMRHVEGLARRAAATELSVLILGETGTGKELVARTIHTLSARAERPFLAVNCGALRPDLALSQLFGHRKGAFTGAHADGVGLVEAANGGTLFLDEVGELPHDVQVTLLRFLESGEYMRLGETQVRRADVRVVAATNRELRVAEDGHHFRRDLLFRLNEIEIRLPALRERGSDVVPLARHFLDFYGGIHGPRLTPEAEAVLQSYGWPGNVRELENVMKRVAALHPEGETLDGASLLPFLSHATRPSGEPERAREDRAAILAAYAEARGNKSRVAEILGVSRKTLYARLKRLNLHLD